MDSRTDFYDELLSKTDIIKLINQYVPLKAKGTSYWGCCPFHHEKTPSFSVSPQKQVYYCFGCKESGNAITFLKKIESIETNDAVKILAKSAGMELPSNNFTKATDKELTKKRERLYLLMRDAARHYNNNLSLPSAKPALDYLAKRGVDKALITKFGLGYSVNGQNLIDYLKVLGYTETEMKEAAVIESGANGNYDVFYERLMFPIINNFGEVIAFGGRSLKQNIDFAKYRNSSKTIIFDKSKTLYGINLLKKRKQQAHIDYIIIVEGYMDVIALHKNGFDTAVASMGTALTFNQAKQLKNYCDKIYISYDGDSAGQTATLRGLDILAEAGLKVKVVTLPDNLDPDDCIKQKGAEFYKNLLKSAKSLIDFKIDSLKNQFNLSDKEEKAKFAVESIKIIKSLDNPVEREEYLKIIHEFTGYTMSALHSQAGITEDPKTKRDEVPKTFSETEKNDSKQHLAKLFILASIAEDKEYVDFSENFKQYFSEDFYRIIIDFFTERKRGGPKNTGILYERVSEDKFCALDEILNYNFLEGDNEKKYINCLNILRIDEIEKEKAMLVKVYNETKDFAAVAKIAELEEKLKQAKIGGESND